MVVVAVMIMRVEREEKETSRDLSERSFEALSQSRSAAVACFSVQFRFFSNYFSQLPPFVLHLRA